MNRSPLPARRTGCIEKIVIIKPTALGDVVQSLPLLPSLRRRFPLAKISWVIHAGLADLLAGHPDLDEIIPYHRHGSWNAWRQLLGTLWSRKFDLAIDLQGLLRTGLMTLATRAPIRLGLETAREGSRWSLTHSVPQTDRMVPAGERYLRVLDFVDAERTHARLTLAVSPQDADFATRHLSTLPHPLIAVHPGARWETKRWPVENFAELLSRVSAKWNAGIVILGSAAERCEADRLEQLLLPTNLAGASGSLKLASNGTVLNLAGETTLKQLAAVLERVDAAVSNDSGPMHLAAGLGTPTLGIFTCTDAVRSGPTGILHETVSTQVGCAASYCKTCPHLGDGHLACHRELKVDRVWQALCRLLRRRGRIKTSVRAA